MVTTEKQARDKVCPRHLTTPVGYCAGSRCMAWRWRCWVNDNGDLFFYDPSGDEHHHKDVKTIERVGYCGLAGDPFSEVG